MYAGHLIWFVRDKFICDRNVVLSAVVIEQGNAASHCVKCSQLADKNFEKFSQDMTAAMIHF